MGEARSASRQIELSAPRAIFAELLAGALDHALPPPTPIAIAYLIDLLDDRVRAPERAEPAIDGGALVAIPSETYAMRLVRRIKSTPKQADAARALRQTQSLGTRKWRSSASSGDPVSGCCW